MAILHTWNKAATGHSNFKQGLACMSTTDSLLLLEDAVYLVLDTGQLKILASTTTQLYALAEDLAARGISAKIPPAIKVVDYKEFVALCLTHDKLVNWI